MENNKVIVILGPTASGKSSMAIKLALKFNGEIISADSRQIYRYANLTTGKVTQREQEMAKHHLIDILNLNSYWSASQFQKKAQKTIADILSRGKLPIICGGTGFWIKALVDNVAFPEVKPDWKLRKKLGKLTAKKLFSMLKKMDARRAKNIDAQNKIHLIRAIEICKTIGRVPTLPHPSPSEGEGAEGGVKFLQIGIAIPKEKLRQNIKKRLEKRLKQPASRRRAIVSASRGGGMIREVENLHKKHSVSWKRLENLGLEFRWIARFLQNKISRQEMEAKLYFDIIHYAKRQMTWFQKDTRIKWLKNYSQIEAVANKFLKK